MEAVLDRLRLGNLVERQAGSVHAFVVDQHDRVLFSRVLGDLSAEDLGPETRKCGGVGAVDGDAKEGVAHEGISSGFGWSDPGALVVQTAVRPPSTGITAPVM